MFNTKVSFELSVCCVLFLIGHLTNVDLTNFLLLTGYFVTREVQYLAMHLAYLCLIEYLKKLTLTVSKKRNNVSLAKFVSANY